LSRLLFRLDPFSIFGVGVGELFLGGLVVMAKYTVNEVADCILKFYDDYITNLKLQKFLYWAAEAARV